MIVITLTKCPLNLRGDLTRWLFELDTNVYVGKVSSRVRDLLWERIVKNLKSGIAVMAYSINNEQGFTFRTHGNTWKIEEYEGLQLMLRPNFEQITADIDPDALKKGVAALRYKHRYKVKINKDAVTLKQSKVLSGNYWVDNYVAFDLETTGLSVKKDCIIEIGAVKICQGHIQAEFSKLINIGETLPVIIEEMTGINSKELVTKGEDLSYVLDDFIDFVGDNVLIAHHSDFDKNFLEEALKKERMHLQTTYFDTVMLAEAVLPQLVSYKLGNLLKFLNIDSKIKHRALNDARNVYLLYEALKKISTASAKK
ncbi:type I-E CRISPR-associated endoribonuclease Cas2e [Pectinatus frisingensis]|uniref:type I-E CRISPR-associated endoribonuclease Cas2e n=1 Tax=Pectinatus frisingensis TaxID=865 RepID=UPI0015F5FBD9|nr:type I-E CRISPR-associated endoribonuclease Cas2e [Pectinatus frisingensis]